MDREWSRMELRETVDMYKSKAWFMDGVHTMPRWPVLPLDHVWPIAERGLCWGTQKISHPQVKGWFWRSREGSAFLSPIIVTDPEEVEQRKGPFREALRPFIEDFQGLWDGYKKKWDDIWGKMYAFDIKNASDIDLEEFYRELVLYEIEVWKDHFFLMQGLASVWLLFEDLAKELCNITSVSALFVKLTSGFKSKAFDSDKAMWELCQKAEELGLKELFSKYGGKELLGNLRSAPKSEEFFKALDVFMDEYGNRTVQLLNFASATWKEQPEIALDRMRILMKQKKVGVRHEEVMAEAEKERQEAEKEVLGKIPVDQREWFGSLLKASQNWNWWNEEHEFWLNDAVYTLIHDVMLEYGKRFVKAGTFDQVEDIFHLRVNDFERVVHGPEYYNLRPEVLKHRAELEAFQNKESQQVVCYEGPVAAIEWIKTLRETHVAFTVGYMPEPQEGVNAALWGICGCPGTVEGVARVVLSEDQLNDIEPGEIVVCPTTYVSWTPIFSIISGLVVDRGGTLTHAAICAREYNIPCILNTFTGTTAIKTGQRIKIQADIGAVFVVD